MSAKKTKRNRPAKRQPPTIRERPKMPPVSEEMKQWSAMLKAELIGWPQVTSRPMFGMSGIYRRKKIFAALPVTRGFDTPSSIIFRFDPMSADLNQRALKEPRITPGTRWFSFEIKSTEDLRDALWWLNQAYEAAKK
jgi:hypothetical protein